MIRRNPRPFFIVGCARSGTSLLSAMLDGHPRLAVADELSFIAGLCAGRLPGLRSSPATVEDVIAHPRFPRLEMDADSLRSVVQDTDPQSYRQLIDTIMSAWADRRGKLRWGEKTPGYLAVAPRLARQFPDAQFLHVIRDGREVATALAERTWGPPTAVSGAVWWRFVLRKRRGLLRRLGPARCLEVRLEGLIAGPPSELMKVCKFLGEEYDGAMLDYPSRLEDMELPPGRDHLRRPPSAGLRDWRNGLPPRQQRAIESVCHPLLAELGYPTTGRSGVALVSAGGVALRDLVITAPRMVRNRLHPQRRSY